MATVYTEVSPDDRDVAAFIAWHLDSINIYMLPRKFWVARQGGTIVALMMLATEPYLALDLIVADPASRPFMRIFKLLRMAEEWLRSQGVPLIAMSIHNSRAHFQSLVRRLGYEKIGEESDDNGNVTETIYGKRLQATLAPAPLKGAMNLA